MAKIFITRKIPEIAESYLRDKGHEVTVYSKDKIPAQKELISFLKKDKYEAVISLLTDKIDKKVFEAVPNIKMYANYAVGFDNIDTLEAKKRGIVVSNAPAELITQSVAEHTIAMTIALSTRIVEGDRYMRKGKYKGWAPMLLIGQNFSGKTLGLIGAGRIGKLVAKYAKALGMKVIYNDMARDNQLESEMGAVYCDTIEKVLAEADFVSLHVPLLDSTRHLVNAERLAKMKKTASIINTSRGPVIDEKALEKALKRGVIAGAALDVFEFEPKISSSLKKMQNVILTPHIASASVEARSEMAKLAAQNVSDFLEGRAPRNIVN